MTKNYTYVKSTTGSCHIGPNWAFKVRAFSENAKSVFFSFFTKKRYPEKFFANSEKASIFNIFLCEKFFWDTFFNEKAEKNWFSIFWKCPNFEGSVRAYMTRPHRGFDICVIFGHFQVKYVERLKIPRAWVIIRLLEVSHFCCFLGGYPPCAPGGVGGEIQLLHTPNVGR